MGLVIRRREGQGISADGDVCVRVIGVRGRSASLLITAPRSVPICRCELLENYRRDEQGRPIVDPQIEHITTGTHELGRLVITRQTRPKKNGLVINGDIVVTVFEIKGGRVSFDITAPRERKIWRSEFGNTKPRGMQIVTDDKTGGKSN